MMLAKLAIPDLLKTKIFPNNGHDIIFLDYDATDKISSRDLSHIVDVVMWP